MPSIDMNRKTQREWGNLTLESRIGIGRAGSRRTGKLVHLIRYEVIIARKGETQPGQIPVGGTFSAHAFCGVRSNGQHTAQVINEKGWTADIVNCERCLGGANVRLVKKLDGSNVYERRVKTACAACNGTGRANQALQPTIYGPSCLQCCGNGYILSAQA